MKSDCCGSEENYQDNELNGLCPKCKEQINVKELTRDYLFDRFSYNEDTGKLYWKARPLDHFKNQHGQRMFNSRFSGKEAGADFSGYGNTYRRVEIDGRPYLVHRVIWGIIYGSTPSEIDHIDGNGLNNRLDNLRCVESKDNQRNRKRPVNNSSGVIGVYWNKKSCKWRVSISDKSKQIQIGMFSNIKDAVSARLAAEKKYDYHPNHGRTI